MELEVQVIKLIVSPSVRAAFLSSLVLPETAYNRPTCDRTSFESENLNSTPFGSSPKCHTTRRASPRSLSPPKASASDRSPRDFSMLTPASAKDRGSQAYIINKISPKQLSAKEKEKELEKRLCFCSVGLIPCTFDSCGNQVDLRLAEMNPI